MKLWDSFQDPPTEESSGSSIDTEWISTLTKLMKIFTYWLVFIIVALSSVLSKLSFLMMTSHVAENSKTPYCDSSSESTNMFALIDRQCFCLLISCGEGAHRFNSDGTNNCMEVGDFLRLLRARVWNLVALTQTLFLQERPQLYVAGIRDCFHLRELLRHRSVSPRLSDSARARRHPRCHVDQLFMLRAIDFV